MFDKKRGSLLVFQVFDFRCIKANNIRHFGCVIYVIPCMKLDLVSSFRILICSEYERNLFLLEENPRAPIVDVKE